MSRITELRIRSYRGIESLDVPSAIRIMSGGECTATRTQVREGSNYIEETFAIEQAESLDRKALAAIVTWCHEHDVEAWTRDDADELRIVEV